MKYRVEDVASLITDGTHYTPQHVSKGVPFLSVKDMAPNGLNIEGAPRISRSDFEAADRSNAAPRDGDILLSKDGTVGKVHVVAGEGEFAVLSSIAIIRPRLEVVDPRYLAWALRSPGFLANAEKSKTGSAVRRIILTDIKRQLIEVPPLPDQSRIAAILDEANAVHQKALKAIDLRGNLLAEEFIARFASVDVAPVLVQDLAVSGPNAIRTGPFGSDLLHSEFVDEGVPVLGIDNVVANEFSWAKPRHITAEKYEELRRYTVRPGDVLISIMGTVGRCAVAPDDIGVAVNTKHLCCISLDRAKCEPRFLQSYFLHHPSARDYLRRTAKGAIMDGLNMGIIKSMPVPLPPIEAQYSFVEWSARARSLNLESRAQQLGSLFASLQHRAFQGKL